MATNIWDKKVNGMVYQIASLCSEMSLDEAIDLARDLNRDRYDSAQLDEGERQGRLLMRAKEGRHLSRSS